MHCSKVFEANQFVEMIYMNKSGKITQRVVKVYGSTDEKVYGYCYLRSGYRSFQKDQILAIYPWKSRKRNKLA